VIRALALLHRAFSRYPASHRVHILIRFLTCPFLRMLDDVPMNASVLDIGSGHALFAVLLAEERASKVLALEPDLRKSLLPSPSTRIRKVAGYYSAVRGTFDVVVICDVAYRLTVDAQRTLFARAFALLKPGGVLLCKEMDPERRWKMSWNRLQEWLNEKLLGITLGSGVVIQTRSEVFSMLQQAGFRDVTARAIDSGYLHPHLLYTARRST
jgi:cyclopropane fatty-acyl-phospholipid synthase-like methyltransferase